MTALPTTRPTGATRRRIGSALVSLGLLGYFTFSLFPVAWMLLLSLKSNQDQLTTHFVFTPTLDSYVQVLGMGDADAGVPFGRFFVNSLVVSFGAVLLALFIGVPAAYAAARHRFAGKEGLMFTLLSFRFAPELVVIIPLAVIYPRLGLFDTHMGMIWVLQLVTLPLIVWILRSYFQDLSPEMEQAALLDGYGRLQAFVKVVLPLVKPGLAAVSLLAFIFAWNNFIFPLTLTSSDAQTVTVGALSFIGSNEITFNLTAAASLIAALPPLILALSIQRFLVRGLSFGSVKD